MKQVFAAILAVMLIPSAVPADDNLDFHYGYRLELRNYDKIEEYTGAPLYTADGSRIILSTKTAILSVPVNGGRPEYLYIPAFYESNITALGFTPDGRELTFAASINTEESKNSVWGDTSSLVIGCLDLETGAVRKLVQDASTGCWSPDGRYFAYIRMDPPDIELILLDPATGAETVLDSYRPALPCFTSDSKYVIFHEDGNLYKISVEGGDPVPLTVGTFDDLTGCSCTYPVCTPDGEWLIYTWIDGRNALEAKFVFTTEEGTTVVHTYYATVWQQHALNLITGEIRIILDDSPWTDTKMAAVSPDGNSICYHITDHSSYYDQKIYIKEIDLPSSGIPFAVAESVPGGFSITGNYPNPFNPETSIAFTIPDDGAVELAVYNMTGQLVRELASGRMSAGRHDITWNGRDDSGLPVSSGVYISRLSAGNLSASKSMMLLK